MRERVNEYTKSKSSQPFNEGNEGTSSRNTLRDVVEHENNVLNR